MLIPRDLHSPGPVLAIFPVLHSPDPHPPGPPLPAGFPHRGLPGMRPHRRTLPPPGRAAAWSPGLRAFVAASRAAAASPLRRRAAVLLLSLREKKMAARSVCRAGSAAGRGLLWGSRTSVSHRAPRGQCGGGAQGGSSAGPREAPQCEVAAGPRPCPGREGHRDATGGAGRAAVAVGAPGPRNRAGRARGSSDCHCHPMRGLSLNRCPPSAPVLGCDRFVRLFPGVSHLFKSLSSRLCPGEQSVSSDVSLSFYRRL